MTDEEALCLLDDAIGYCMAWDDSLSTEERVTLVHAFRHVSDQLFRLRSLED